MKLTNPLTCCLYPVTTIILHHIQPACTFSTSVKNSCTQNKPPLLGKKALVTGSSGGIGKAIAQSLASAGAHVLVHYNTRYEGAVSTCQYIRSSIPDGKCDGILQCDFRSPSNIKKMCSLIDEKWDGKIDILVNNAGLITKRAQEDDNDDMSSWHETMAVNLHAPLQLSRWAYKRMKKQKEGGNIIMVSSIHGSIPVEYMTAYGVSKAALDQLTRGLSSEWAPHGVRVNAIAPGIIPVERTEAVLSTQQSHDMWMKHLPVGRYGSVEDIGEGVVYLCRAGWASGSVLTLDGGMIARSNMPMRPRPDVGDAGHWEEDICDEVKYESLE